MIALWSEGSRERMAHVLAEHGLHNLTNVASWPQALALPKHQTALAALGVEAGVETSDIALISEEDILGERLVRARRASKRAENFIAEVTSLSAGDLVVHPDHGIGRFIGLRAIEGPGAPHDCLEVSIMPAATSSSCRSRISQLLSRYGSNEAGAELDRLGSGAWQSRKARMKNRIREIASELIKVAAERQLREAPRLEVGAGLDDEFWAEGVMPETMDGSRTSSKTSARWRSRQSEIRTEHEGAPSKRPEREELSAKRFCGRPCPRIYRTVFRHV